jgi:hypothetical protein
LPAAAWTKAHDAASVVLVPAAFVGTVGAPPCHVEGAIEVHCTVEVDDAAEGVGARKGIVAPMRAVSPSINCQSPAARSEAKKPDVWATSRRKGCSIR